MPPSQISCITKRFAEFCLSLSYDDLPPQVIAEAKKAILDTLGVGLVGATEQSTQMLWKTFEYPCAVNGATVLGATTQTIPTVAALLNGYAAHALDYDDSQHDCGTHMSAPVLPAALAIAEISHSSGKDLLTAYIGGIEVGCRLARVGQFGLQLHHHGIHSTGFLGHFGAVAAAGRLIGLDTLQMRRSFGVAASQAAGLLRSFGTMCKPLHAGNAAHNALLSTLLAKQGFTGPPEIFDGEQNIFAIVDSQTDPDELFHGLGQNFEITHNTLKIFACAGWRNPIVEALIHLATIHKLQPADIKKVQLWAYSEMLRLPNYPEPKTGLEGKFSTQHAAAVALADRAGGLAQFTDARVVDSVLVKLGRTVTIETGEKLEPYQIRALVTTFDGREVSHFIPVPKGDPRNPLSWDELLAKFRANAITALPPDQVERVTQIVERLETTTDVSELTRMCRCATD